MTLSSLQTPSPAQVPGLPHRAGLGLKNEHFTKVLETSPDIGFFEVHAENYMVAGGPFHHYLGLIREQYPLSLHGVGLSIGGEGPLDRAHLARLAALIERYQPHSFSEHLAWSSHGPVFLNDLLPLAYDDETLKRVCEHIDQVQTRLQRPMLLENPSTYLQFQCSTLEETDFISEAIRRTGCGLLLDVNNLLVSCTNHRSDPGSYLDAFPLDRVGEVHLGGHAAETLPSGPLLIDAHGAAVADPVWSLYADVLDRAGPLPSLVEWDNDVPDWPVLLAEAQRAQTLLSARTRHAAE